MKIAIWWIRRDIRIHDNATLQMCIDNAEVVIPIFIFDPSLTKSARFCPDRFAFLLLGLEELDNNLKRIGSKLIIRIGKPIEVFHTLLEEISLSGEAEIYAECDHSPYAQKRDLLIKQHFPLTLIGSTAFYPPGLIIKRNNEPYNIYTPFCRAWKQFPLPSMLEAKKVIDYIPSSLRLPSQQIPTKPALSQGVYLKAGEIAALKQLSNFCDEPDQKIYKYNKARNFFDISGTSQLSPYLRFGMISIQEVVKQAYNAINQAKDSYSLQSAKTWLDELIWRDFYINIIFHYPYITQRNFKQINKNWLNKNDDFEKWCNGITGFPIIDACMRELKETSWMHNRGRMIVASFLTKNLLIDWRWGEKWFMQHLLDGDVASNNGGWQWVASTGTDAVPYFRIFNPYLQSKKYDPNGVYIRKWVPELKTVSNKYIHSPNVMPEELQQKARCIIGKDYPEPIIDYNSSRKRALDFFRK